MSILHLVVEHHPIQKNQHHCIYFDKTKLFVEKGNIQIFTIPISCFLLLTPSFFPNVRSRIMLSISSVSMTQMKRWILTKFYLFIHLVVFEIRITFPYSQIHFSVFTEQFITTRCCYQLDFLSESHIDVTKLKMRDARWGWRLDFSLQMGGEVSSNTADIITSQGNGGARGPRRSKRPTVRHTVIRTPHKISSPLKISTIKSHLPLQTYKSSVSQ